MNRTPEQDATRALRRFFAVVSPAPRPTAPYDFVYRAPSTGALLHVKIKRALGASVTIKDAQFRRLAALGDFAFWINGALITHTSLIGVAHRHVHALDGTAKTVVFRVKGGRVLPPRWCFGKCEGAIA